MVGHNHGPCSAARPLSLVCIPHGDSQMNYRDYLATTTHSSDQVLGDWQWLIGTHLVLWHVTKAGDAFLRIRPMARSTCSTPSAVTSSVLPQMSSNLSPAQSRPGTPANG